VDDRSAGDPTLRLRDSEQESQTVIKVGADFYIHALSLTSRRATRLLVNGESFAVFEVGGDILQTPNEPLGSFGVACSAMFKIARAKVAVMASHSSWGALHGLPQRRMPLRVRPSRASLVGHRVTIPGPLMA
jgi:hypothetical protein